MRRISLLLMAILLLSVTAGSLPIAAPTDSWQSTRVTDSTHHQTTGTGRYPYRTKSDYVLRELDLRPGDVVVDIGAGDGFWAEQMAKFVGKEGTIYASEVEQMKVDRMKERFTDLPQVRAYLCPTDVPGWRRIPASWPFSPRPIIIWTQMAGSITCAICARLSGPPAGSV